MREIATVLGKLDDVVDTEIPKDLVCSLFLEPVRWLTTPVQHITTMSRYSADFPFPVAYPPQRMTNVLAEWLSKKDLKQAHIAETEKYAHVTFFFNGGVEKGFEKEERYLIASPKVATYDLQPEMSAQEVADKVAEVVKSKENEFVMCNFAPPDMVQYSSSRLVTNTYAVGTRLATLVSWMRRSRPSPLPTRPSAQSTRPVRRPDTSC